MLQVFDPVEDYLKLLRTIFDFDALKALLRKPDFTFTFDGMHGVSGPYARRILVEVAHFPSSRSGLWWHLQAQPSKACACTLSVRALALGNVRCKQHDWQ